MHLMHLVVMSQIFHIGYALVICNHGPHPRGMAGIAVEMSGALTKVLRKYPRFALYRQKGP